MPTLVEFEASNTRSHLDEAQAGDVEAYSEVCRVYETRLLRQAIALIESVRRRLIEKKV